MNWRRRSIRAVEVTAEEPAPKRRPSDRDTPRRVMIDMPVEVRGLTLTAISVAVVVVLLQFMQSILIPFVLAGLLFYALDPLVDALEHRRLPRAIGAGLILMLVVTGGGAITLALQDQFMTVIDELPAGARK